MRDIKFRAWDRKKRKFIYPDIFGRQMPSNWKVFYNLMQYTGIKDKNGKEIYEGDILKVIDGDVDVVIIEVFWDNTGLTYPIDYEFGNYCKTSIGWAMRHHQFKFEIIGNIYENPELLKE